MSNQRIRECIQKVIEDQEVKDIHQIDLNLPLFRTAPVSLILELIEENKKNYSIVQTKKFEKWMGESNTLDLFPEEKRELIPLEKAMYENLFVRPHKGRTILISSKLDVWHVGYCKISGKTPNLFNDKLKNIPTGENIYLYYLNSSVSTSHQEYYLLPNVRASKMTMKFQDPQTLANLNTKTTASVNFKSTWIESLSTLELSPVKKIEEPIHELIRNQIRIL